MGDSEWYHFHLYLLIPGYVTLGYGRSSAVYQMLEHTQFLEHMAPAMQGTLTLLETYLYFQTKPIAAELWRPW